MNDTAPRRLLLIATLLLSAVAWGGCLQIQVTVEAHEAGGATVTERVRFSSTVLQLDHATPDDQKLTALLTKEHVLGRMKEMGKGIRLTSHEVKELEDGSRESVSVFEIGDLEELRLVNPFLDQGRPERLMRIRFEPIYKVVHSFHRLGQLMMYLVPAERPKPEPRKEEEEPAPPPTPLQLQIFRSLQPIFLDLARELEIKLQVIYPRPISLGPVRDMRSATRTITMLSFAYDDLDEYGMQFLQNEELMLDLLRMQFGSTRISDHVRNFPGNKTLPVFRSSNIYGIGRFRVPPTNALFKKYFAGRPKSEGGDQ